MSFIRLIENGSAIGRADDGRTAGPAPAIATQRTITREGAVRDARGGQVPDGAALAETAFTADGFISNETAGAHDERAAVAIRNRSTAHGLGRTRADSPVIDENIVNKAQLATDVQDAASPPVSCGVAVGDRQAGDGDGQPGVDVEHSASVVAADRPEFRVRTVDCHAVLNG